MTSTHNVRQSRRVGRGGGWGGPAVSLCLPTFLGRAPPLCVALLENCSFRGPPLPPAALFFDCSEQLYAVAGANAVGEAFTITSSVLRVSSSTGAASIVCRVPSQENVVVGEAAFRGRVVPCRAVLWAVLPRMASVRWGGGGVSHPHAKRMGAPPCGQNTPSPNVHTHTTTTQSPVHPWPQTAPIPLHHCCPRVPNVCPSSRPASHPVHPPPFLHAHAVLTACPRSPDRPQRHCAVLRGDHPRHGRDVPVGAKPTGALQCADIPGLHVERH